MPECDSALKVYFFSKSDYECTWYQVAIAASKEEAKGFVCEGIESAWPLPAKETHPEYHTKYYLLHRKRSILREQKEFMKGIGWTLRVSDIVPGAVSLCDPFKPAVRKTH